MDQIQNTEQTAIELNPSNAVNYVRSPNIGNTYKNVGANGLNTCSQKWKRKGHN